MSIRDLKLAIGKASPPASRAIVSSSLLGDLLQAGELTKKVRKFSVPSDPKLKAVIEDWLTTEGILVELIFVTWTLQGYDSMEVLLDSQVGFDFPASGPNSFELK